MTKERSKRSYKRNEIIHAWIHKKENAPEVIYYKDSRHSYNCVVGIGDYLFKGNKIDNTLDSILKMLLSLYILLVVVQFLIMMLFVYLELLNI